MGKSERTKTQRGSEPLTTVLATFRKPEETGFASAWVGMEPTFSNKKAIRKWFAMSETEEGEEEFFHDPYMLRMQKTIAHAMVHDYKARQKKGDDACLFHRVDVDKDVDQWGVRRQNLSFRWKDDKLDPFEVRFGLDPETFEYSIKPVPLVWFYDARFVRFLQRFVWDVPQKLGLLPSMAHGGGQFSVSAKTFMTGSLLADTIASRLDHPEMANWIASYPNPDERAFRATRQRHEAFVRILDAYWAGGFHPRANGELRVENAYLDRGFGPTPTPPAEVMDKQRGPVGDAREVFQTNFAFGRAIRTQAQNVHPGYWQSAHPDEDGYRPDQIMRYSEGNLNRLQIAGEWHVKSGKVLDIEDVPEFDASLEIGMLYDEASWEYRAQMTKTSAEDFAEAVLLEMHHSQYLQEHPHVVARASLVQDQMMGDAEDVLERLAPQVLEGLHKKARKLNLEASRGRLKSDWIEPETLYWAVWKELGPGDRADIAREAILGFIERVEQAAEKDPRPRNARDPMEAHRHRIHPLLWKALEAEGTILEGDARLHAECKAWSSGRKRYLARRPMWSVTGAKPPWKS